MKKVNYSAVLKRPLTMLALMLGLIVTANAQTSPVSGRVFNDLDRNTRIDAGETLSGLPTSLYVYLVRLNLVIDSSHVADDGSYSVDAPNSLSYTLQLSTQQYAIGASVLTTPIDLLPPTGWVTTGENNSGTNTGSGDSNPNGIIQVTVGTTALVNRNFGITCKTAGTSGGYTICRSEASIMPLSDFITGQDLGGTWSHVSGSGIIFDTLAGTVQLTDSATTSTYSYDIAATTSCSASSSIATITVAPVPVTNQSLTICAGDSACVKNPLFWARSLNPEEEVCYTIAGTYMDTLKGAAQYGCDSIVITTLTVNACGSIGISGNVFNDMNDNTIIDADETFSTLPQQLYVYLVDANNIIVDSASVAANGSYSVNGDAGQTFTLKLSTDQYPLGTQVTATTIDTTPPAEWETTGENGDGNTGSGDGTPDGSLVVVLGTDPVDNQNFGIAETAVLPIQLVYFNGLKFNDGVMLNWRTSNEQNSKGFEIENSEDATNWASIGFVISKSQGAGNTFLDYSFGDTKIVFASNFYRLKQLDEDGKFSYSPIVSVVVDKIYSIAIQPNPAKDYITVKGLAGTETIKIYSMHGRLVNEIVVTGSTTTIALDELAAGMYHVNVVSASGVVFVSKVIKL